MAKNRDLRSASAERSVERQIAAANFEAISRIDGLDIENIAPCESKNSLDWCGHVFVHAVGKLDHDDRPFTRCTYQPADDGAGATAKLAEHDLHDGHPSMSVWTGHKLHNAKAAF